MTLTDLSHEIADDLENKAAQEHAQKIRDAEIHYNAYVQACEDFGGRLREHARQQDKRE
jgi:hypothetical protein